MYNDATYITHIREFIYPMNLFRQKTKKKLINVKKDKSKSN